MNTQAVRAGQLLARFDEKIAQGVEVSVRRIVWKRALFVFSDRVFVRAQCRGLTVANRFLMGEVSEELCSVQVSKLLVSEEVVLHLIALVLRIWIRGRPLLVLRVPLDARLVGYGEPRPEIQRWHGAANNMEAEHSGVAHGHADVPALQKPLHWIRFASCGFHVEPRFWLAGELGSVEPSLVCPLRTSKGITFIVAGLNRASSRFRGAKN